MKICIIRVQILCYNNYHPEYTDNGPIIVNCMDGASQSGLFCVCYVACETMASKGRVDMFHSIKRMKRRRSQIIPSLVRQSCNTARFTLMIIII